MSRRSTADGESVRPDEQLTAGLRRARRTAASGRALMAIAGIVVALTHAGVHRAPAAPVAGFLIVLVTSLVQLKLPRLRWLIVEETVAPLSALLIVGLGPEHVRVTGLLWLCCVACGVLARGGRRHWSGRAILLVALALPVVRYRAANVEYGAFCLATIVLLLTCGRVTRELRALHESAREEADHDALTGVFTRRRFRAELEHLVSTAVPGGVSGAAAPPTGLLLVDLDHFRAVNKTAGHAAGDALLCQVADRLAAILGEDAAIGRLGGDEFAVIVSATDPAGLAHTLRQGLREDPGVRVSLGVAHVPRSGGDADGLLRAVDVALRVAKRAGGPGVSVYVGEGLSVAVQPIVAATSGAVHAYEALARFSSRLTSDPLHWFALADELGMRDELELACLAAGLRVLAQRPEGSAFAINLSGTLLLDPRVSAQLDALPTLDGLILELTENSVIHDTDGLAAEIRRLRARGLRFAVDDVGAGYSGLRQISVLHPDYLKLDRSLVTGVDSDRDRAALVAAMVSWGEATGGHLVAEGVETEAELDVLISVGVPLVQGYYFARPGWPWPEVRTPGPRTATPAPAPGVTPALLPS
jgi:diguanylate cyclase (GGDEF)-like protein